jgi:site-specific recombinase XerD
VTRTKTRHTIIQLEDTLAAWIDYLGTQRGCAQTTVSQYRDTVQAFLAHLLPTDDGDSRHLPTLQEEHGQVNAFADITPEHVTAYLQHQRASHGASVRTIRNRLRVLRGFFSHLVDTGIISSDPTAGIKPSAVLAEPAIHRTLTDNEVEQLLAQVKGDKWIQIRDRAMLRVFLATGIRVTEMVSLDVSDLSTKGTLCMGVGTAARTLPLDRTTLEAVHDWLGVREAFGEPKGRHLFISRLTRGPISARQVQNCVKRYARAAELDDVNTHTLRHTFGRHLYKSGMSSEQVRRRLGRERPAYRGAYGVVEEDAGPNRCAVCDVEIDHRSTWCRRHAVMANWATPGFYEKWKKARYGDK